VVGLGRFFLFCRQKKWSDYCSGLNWLTLDAAEKCVGAGREMKGAHISVVVAKKNIEDFLRVVC
jgi:hypothetical protein